MVDDYLPAVRDICLSFPEARERETWGHPTFRVRDKIFTSYGQDEEGRISVTMKAAPGEQEALLAVGEPYFYPAYVGSHGWIGINLGHDTDWEEIEEMIDQSYRMTAPKKLSTLLDEPER